MSSKGLAKPVGPAHSYIGAGRLTQAEMAAPGDGWTAPIHPALSSRIWVVPDPSSSVIRGADRVAIDAMPP